MFHVKHRMVAPPLATKWTGPYASYSDRDFPQLRPRAISEICADMSPALDDPSKVVPACRNLAERGNAFAQFMLGFIYLTGMRGHKSVVQQDSAEAAKWLGLAAEQGNALSQLSLGALYFKGNGVPKNYVQAYMWSELAASADENLHDMAVQNRDAAAAQMTPDEIALPQKLVRECKPKTAP